MNNFYQITLIVQIISVIIISLVMFYFAREYKQKYLKYWALSFIALAVFLICALIRLLFQTDDSSFVYLIRLINVFILSLAGYSQLAFLILGTKELIHQGSINKYHFRGALGVVIVLSLFVTFYKSWSADYAQVRYLVRIGARYFVAGTIFIATTIYLYNKETTLIIGKRIVMLFFAIYGLEMLVISFFIIEYFLTGSSQYLNTMANYHGLFELLIYPMIALGLVMWLLEVERERSITATNKLFHLNKTDKLTGLPNKTALEDFYRRWIANNHSENLTLVLYGVDKLQTINDAEGVNKVDKLLIELSKKLDFLFKQEVFLGRLHGDIFVAVMKGYSEKTLLKAQRMRNKILQKFKSQKYTYQVHMSAGIAELNETNDLKKALYNANICLQSAKDNGGNSSVVYVKGMQIKRSLNSELENELTLAFKHDQFEMYYQPIWSTQKQIIVSFEALLRWNHPTKGILTPDAFLYALIELDKMKKLDLWVLKTVIKQINKWQKQGLDSVPVAINISPETLECYDVIERILTLTEKYKVNKNLLTIEVTENTAMNNIESGKVTLTEISDLGLNIAIDDFGTGYSSLNYLKTFPSDIIKFDRSFITNLQENDINHEILKSLIPLCHRLNKKVIVEGIEKIEQADILNELNITGYQGYLYSYPITSEKATKMLINKKLT